MADPGVNTASWWKADKGQAVANHLLRVASAIETAQTQKRWRSLVFYRHLTGRPNCAQFAYGMARRPISAASYYSSFQFTPPTYNLIAACADVYINRLFRNHSFLSVVPDRGDFAMRQKSKVLEQWVEGAFDTTGFWELWPHMGIDALGYGSGWFKFAPDSSGTKPDVTVVHPDELLFRNEDEKKPKDVIHRVWANRDELLETYGDDKEKAAAIKNAQSAFPAFYYGNGLDTSNVIPLLDGYRAKVGTRPGRNVLAVGTCALVDEKYDSDMLPVEGFRFNELTGGLFGQGLAEILLRTNEEIDSLLADDAENIHRLGFPKWLVEANSGVNPDSLGDTSGAVVEYTYTKPELVAPPEMSKEHFEHVDRLIRFGMQRAHISESAVSGEKPSALQSAVALEKWSQIDDANYAEMGGRLEALLVRCGYQMIRLGKQLKPSVTLAGKRRQQIKWSDLKVSSGQPEYLRAFAMSRLPQTMAGLQELIDTMLARGTISKALHARLSQVPDIDGAMDLLNAPQDSVDGALDKIIETGEYIPPSPFMDLAYAKQACESRYLLEEDDGTPRDRLDLLLQYRAAVIDLDTQKNTPDTPAPSAAAFTGEQPDGAAPAVAKQVPMPNPANPLPQVQ